MKKQLKSVTSLALTLTMMTSMLLTLPESKVYAEDQTVLQKEFYVAVNGSDENDGTEERPFASVEKARQAVADINQDMTGDIVVNLRAGDYYMDETLILGEKDSGTNGHQVIYRSVDGIGQANLIGGDRITGWELADESDLNYDLDEAMLGKVYKVQLDQTRYDFNTLYVNDSRAVMARTRNRDNNPNFPMAKGEYMRSTGGHNNNLNMNYNPADLTEKEIAGMVNAQNRGEKEIAQVFVWDGGDWDWFTNTIPIASIQTANNEFKFPTPPLDYPEKYRTKYNIGAGARYFLQGNLAFLDVEGEYHYNKSTGILYYYPKAKDGAIEEQIIVAPTMQEVIKFKGADKVDADGNVDLAAQPDPAKQVHDITLDGIGVKNTEFADYFTYSWNWGDGGAGIGHFPKASEGSTNPSYCESAEREEFRVGAVTVTDANHITLVNTRIKNSGMYGIFFAGDNQYNKVENSVVEHTGNGGIIFDGGYPAIGKYNNHNSIRNVLIHDVGENVGHAVGFTLMSSGQNDISHMEIYNTPKRAMLLLGGYRRDRWGGDANYDEIKDMYTVGNHLSYIHVHDAQQDAGEDSAVFLSWLLSGKDVNALHGSNDPNHLKTNLEGIDTSIDRYNYFDQFLITDVGADPSVIEKCTVGGLDTAMGASGSNFTNIRAANTQHHLLAIRDRDGGGYGDMYVNQNTTNNLFTDDVLKTFDDSKMEYDKIGLQADFPKELRTSKRTYPDVPENLYFGDDFEASKKLDTKKWTVEQGKVEMHIGYGYMSEDPQIGKRSLPINADLNPNGVVVSRSFDQPLNKIVEVKYMDRRKDYANNDRGDAVPTEILPNSFLRVDDGENALGIGAVGRVSKDYYQIKKGDELIQTKVRRSFGWHTFKFDYTSETDVKLYIDDELVGTFDDVSTSFSYIGMGDWDGIGGKAFFDQLYVYGGKEAPPVEDLPTPPPPAALDKDIIAEDFEGAPTVEWLKNKGNATISVVEDPDDAGNKAMYIESPDDLVYVKTEENWSNYTFEFRLKIAGWGGMDQLYPWDNIAPVWNAGFQDDKGNFNRYSLKYRRDTKDFSLYKRAGGDTDMLSQAAPADFEGVWHDYKIVTNDGLITAYIDGEKIFEHADSSNTSGTIGFDGINGKFYVDDIKVERQIAGTPTASKESGNFSQPFMLELLSSAEGESIYYTLDGSNPMEHGIEYDEDAPIAITKTTTLKMAAYQDGMCYSDVVTYQYDLEEAPPIVDKTPLRDKLAQAKAITAEGWTSASYASLQTAIAEAEAAMDTITTDEQVAAAVTKLQAAIESLEKAPEETEVDKSLLQSTYDYALTLDTTGVAESAVQFFETAKLNAKAVLEDPKATEEAVSKAWDDLLEGIWGLGLYQGDKTTLKTLIGKAESMLPNESKYVAKNWQQLLDALDAARLVRDDGNAMEEDIQPAAEVLLKAIWAQRYKAEKSNLQALISKANALDLSQYTEESVRALNSALEEANAVMANDGLSEDDQSVVDGAANRLQKAINGLEKKSDSGSSSGGADSSNPSSSSSNNSSSSSSQSGGSAQTGDSLPSLLIGLCGLAMAVGFLFIKKQKKA